MSPAQFTVAASIVFAMFFAANYLFAPKFLTPFVRRVFLTLVAVETALGLCDVWRIYMPAFWNWFFYLHAELNAGALLSSSQLFALSVAAGAVGFHNSSNKLRYGFYWWVLAAVCLFLSVDDFFMFHESLAVAIGLDQFKAIYASAGLTLAIGTFITYWFRHRNETKAFAMIFGGLALLGGSGIGYEILMGFVPCSLLIGCGRSFVFGESLEIIGATIMLSGVLLHLEVQMMPSRIWLTRWLTLAGGAFAFASMVAYTWVLPAVESRLYAEPVHVKYAQSSLTFLGYHLSPAVISDQRALTLTAYWRAEQTMAESYNISAHLITRPEADSVAQADWLSDALLGFYPTDAWLPGVPVRTVLTLTLPPDLPAPRSYQIILRVWQYSEGVPIVEADRPLLVEDTLILQDIPALPQASPPAPPIESGYRLADTLTLFGYSLPDQAVPGGDLNLKFWWRKSNPFASDPVQFLHLISNGQAVYTNDQQPFGGGFPVSDWPSRVDLMDEWSITLPNDLPPGRYDVYTGLYEWPSLARLNVVDADGQAVVDNTIRLGTLVLTSPAGQ